MRAVSPCWDITAAALNRYPPTVAFLGYDGATAAIAPEVQAI
jgi:hypothetical protein